MLEFSDVFARFTASLLYYLPTFARRGMNLMDPQTTGLARILLATADATLRHTRTEILRSFGFHVSASQSKQHALQMFATERYDVLVLGNTLDVKACRELGAAFRRHQPNGRVVEILDASNFGPKNNPDATVVALSGPLALRDIIHSQLRSAGT